ncbi:DUF6557 family protein [uncultured Limosilactobacillus sp.]|uniref:DUF6557 family protein n=1 Tax=uncultured Limosilactobacillus sp. TaxID=2837629 RepID=UPI0025FA4681|nr:DUF6557 family protein [uncultured Limosilactobacillus sp.]
MKTVQSFLQQTDPQLLIDNYLLKYPLELEDFEPTKTVGEVEEEARRQLLDYLQQLKTMEARENTDGLIFYAYHHVEERIPEPSFGLSTVNDLLEEGAEAQMFSFTYTLQGNVMGFFVAENQLTRHYLTELLVEIMHELTFFGFQQEKLPAAYQHLIDEDHPLTPVEDQQPLPATDEWTPAELRIVQQLQAWEKQLATESRAAVIEEIVDQLETKTDW